MRKPRTGHPRWVAGVLFVMVAACGRGDAQKGTSPEEARRKEPQPLERRTCGGGTTQDVDANGDGKADIRHHVEGGVRTCSEIDMNFDGKTDVARFYAKDGSVAFEQHDFDFDGKLDEQAAFEAGTLKSKQLDTNFDGLIDTWLWCNGAFVERAERARHEAGLVDTIEIYQLGLLSEIQYDEDSNGKPEKWEIYRDGELVEVKLDDTNDGTPDRTEAIVSEYDKDTPVSCDGSPVNPEPPPSAAPPAEGAEQPTESENELREDTGQDPVAPAGDEAKPEEKSSAKKKPAKSNKDKPK